MIQGLESPDIIVEARLPLQSPGRRETPGGRRATGSGGHGGSDGREGAHSGTTTRVREVSGWEDRQYDGKNHRIRFFKPGSVAAEPGTTNTPVHDGSAGCDGRVEH